MVMHSGPVRTILRAALHRLLPVGGAEMGILLIFLFTGCASGQFVDRFEESELREWRAYSGDGKAEIAFKPNNGYATIYVDATEDRYNVWWAVVNRAINEGLELAKLDGQDHAIRFEAKIRVSHAPRRINMHVYTKNQPRHHKNLMEFDIPDTTQWHEISLTTDELNVSPGDSVFAQLSLIDWGRGAYAMDVKYVKAYVINLDGADPDKGNPLPYRPEVPDLDTFEESLPVAQDATIDRRFPHTALNSWKTSDQQDTVAVLTVNSGQMAIMRWSFDSYREKDIDGWSVLELTVQSAWRNEDYPLDELGRVRVSEILAGDPDWKQDSVTWSSFTGGRPLPEVVNPQMILDLDIEHDMNDKVYVTIPEPVMQRLLSGRSKGLALRPLGPIQVSFAASDNKARGNGPILHFNTR